MERMKKIGNESWTEPAIPAELEILPVAEFVWGDVAEYVWGFAVFTEVRATRVVKCSGLSFCRGMKAVVPEVFIVDSGFRLLFFQRLGGVGSDLRPGGVVAMRRFTAADGFCCSGMDKGREGIMVGRIDFDGGALGLSVGGQKKVYYNCWD